MAIAGDPMADLRIIVRTLTLERAIRTVIYDLRIPKKLCTALSVDQDQQGDLDGCETDWVPRGPGENARLLKTNRPSLVEVTQTYNIQSKPHEYRNIPICLTARERESKISLWHDDELLDWSSKSMVNTTSTSQAKSWGHL